MPHGLLLINLGTPDSPSTSSVRQYLKEFLSDKRVIDLWAPLRYLLLYAFILPFRPKQSAHAYQAIWTKEGSPLLINSQKLVKQLQESLGPDFQVALGMRYGKPSIAHALNQLATCNQLTILPLYPQYSSAANGSSIEKVLTLLAQQSAPPTFRIIRDFYQHPGFIHAQGELIRPHLNSQNYLLFSFHGIPQHHLTKVNCQEICQKACKPISVNTQDCYRAHCFASSRALAEYLELEPNQYTVAFQSRLGKTPWIKPYTDEILPQLIKQGIKNLVVVCPSFVADCLETLEEIGIRAQQQWRQLGGQAFTLIPCVNDQPLWVKGIIDICGFPQLAN